MRVTPRLWCGCTRSGSGCGVPSPRVDVGSLAGARSLNERSSQRQAETGGGATSPLGHALRLPPEIGDEKDPGRFPGRDLFLYSRRHRPLSADHTLILPHKGGCVTKYFVHARSCAQMRVCARETYVRKTSTKGVRVGACGTSLCPRVNHPARCGTRRRCFWGHRLVARQTPTVYPRPVETAVTSDRRNLP
jgi:hypothetical protein